MNLEDILKPGAVRPELLYDADNKTVYKGVSANFEFDPYRDPRQVVLHMFGQGTYVTFDIVEAIDFLSYYDEEGRIAKFNLTSGTKLFDYPQSCRVSSQIILSSILVGLYEKAVHELESRCRHLGEGALQSYIDSIRDMAGERIDFLRLAEPIAGETLFDPLIGSRTSRAVYTILLDLLGYQGVVYPQADSNTACIWDLSCLEFDGLFYDNFEI